MNTTTIPASREHLLEEFNVLVAETEALVRSAAQAGSDTAGAAGKCVSDELASASERLARIRDRASRQITSAAHATDHYVHEKPWQAVGIVAALSAVTGVVAGMLIARR